MQLSTGGVEFGNGYEVAIGSAVSRGEFRDGTLILARREDLLKIAHERESNPDLEQMNEMIANAPKHDSWCISSTEIDTRPSFVFQVRLKDGGDGWDVKDGDPARVIVLRGFNCG